MKKITVVDIQRMKQEKKKIVTMTAYDFQMARIIDKAGVDIILIGDSGGRYLLGHEDNNSVTMDEMVLMARCVSRGAKQALVVADMPFMSYQVSREDALRNAGRLIQESGAQAVKLEVGAALCADRRSRGQSRHPGHGAYGTHADDDDRERLPFRIGRRSAGHARRQALEAAGAFSLLLTGISADLAEELLRRRRFRRSPASAPATVATARSALLTESWVLPWKSSSRPRAAYGPVSGIFI